MSVVVIRGKPERSIFKFSTDQFKQSQILMIENLSAMINKIIKPLSRSNLSLPDNQPACMWLVKLFIIYPVYKMTRNNAPLFLFFFFVNLIPK